MNFASETNNGNNGNNEDLEQMSMAELVDSSLAHLKEGELVTGTVVAVNDDSVMVDVGFKSEGLIPADQFRDKETGELTVKPGDEVEVFVERMDEGSGEIRLSRDRAARLKTWRQIEDAFKEETPVTGKVLERVKGGLAVDIGVRAFLPGSLVDLRPNRRLEEYVGQEITAKIISFDRRRSNVVLSRKAVLEEETSHLKEELMETLEEGKLVTGVVKNITDYGVFIDLGGLDGLLHITDISWGRVGHPSEYFKVGEEVDVVVLRFDRERERVSLGYKQRFEDPWTFVPEKYPIGKRVQGKVVSIVDYGAFVELEEGVEGLIHVSEMSWTRKVKNPRSILEMGQEVEVVVSEVDPDKRRLSLSLRATEPNPWETVAEQYQIGSKIKGIVRNLTDFGAFVEIVPGVDGLVHISDMSWTRRIHHPSEVVQKGEEVEAIITAIDVVNQRISLSMKELMPNEWEEYANTHHVGDEVDGKVTNITDFGVFIELAPGVEGLCHVSEIDRDPGVSLTELFEPGQAVRCRILRVDWSENRIGLSMHGVSQEDVGSEPVTGAGEAGGGIAPETAMAAALKASGLVQEEEEEPESAEAQEAEAAPEPPEAQEETAADAGEAKASEQEAAAGEQAGEGTESAEAEDDAEASPAEPVEAEEAVEAEAADEAEAESVAEAADEPEAEAEEPEETSAGETGEDAETAEGGTSGDEERS